MGEDINNYGNIWAHGYNYKSPLIGHEVGVIMKIALGAGLDIGGTVAHFILKKDKKAK